MSQENDELFVKEDQANKGASQDRDTSAGGQIKDTFSELGNSSDNMGDPTSEGAAASGPPGEEPVRDWPPVHMDETNG